MLRLFFNAERFAPAVEFHHPEPPRVVHAVAENRGAMVFFRIDDGLAQDFAEPRPVKDVVPEDHGAAAAADKALAEKERLREAVRGRLHHVRKLQAELFAAAEQLGKPRGVQRRRENQDLPNAGKH